MPAHLLLRSHPLITSLRLLKTYCAKCELDAKKWWLHLADCAIAFDEKCEKDFGRFSNAPKCLDVLADRSEDWKVSWLLSELEAGWNEIKPLLDSKDAGWECEASGYAEGSPDDIEKDTFNVDVEDDGTYPAYRAKVRPFSLLCSQI